MLCTADEQDAHTIGAAVAGELTDPRHPLFLYRLVSHGAFALCAFFDFTPDSIGAQGGPSLPPPLFTQKQAAPQGGPAAFLFCSASRLGLVLDAALGLDGGCFVTGFVINRLQATLRLFYPVGQTQHADKIRTAVQHQHRTDEAHHGQRRERFEKQQHTERAGYRNR